MCPAQKGQKMDFSDVTIVDPDNYVASGGFNPYNTRPMIIYNEYGVLCVVYADNEQDALDAAADADALKCQRLDDVDVFDENGDLAEYVLLLGNYGTPYDSENLRIKILSNMSPEKVRQITEW